MKPGIYVVSADGHERREHDPIEQYVGVLAKRNRAVAHARTRRYEKLDLSVRACVMIIPKPKKARRK